MANVLSLKNLKNKVSRNGFDMSEKRAFTAKVGEIIPCFVLETIPGDHISINPSHFTRTLPVNTAAYTQLREYVHYYHVPYRLLHSQADQFFSDNCENPTRASSIKAARGVGTMLPYITYKSVFKYLIQAKEAGLKDTALMKSFQTSCKLLEYLGYGDFLSAFEYANRIDQIGPHANVRLNPFVLLAYQKIYQDHFRNSQWEKSSPFTCNIDYAKFGSELSLNEIFAPSATETPGNEWLANDMFTLRYCDYNRDYFHGMSPNAQYGDYAVAKVDFDEKKYDELRLSGVFQGDGIENIKKVLSETYPGPSVMAIRKAEALQKYKEIKQSGDRDYKTFLEKIFNVNVSNDRSDLCTYLGGYNASVDIAEVVNTSLNGESNANVQGKGISSGGSNNIEFDAKEFGVIIGVYTCRPNLDYALDAPAKMNMRVTLDDFANPVFDRIGMETINLDEIMSPYLSVLSRHIRDEHTRVPVGYVPRYTSYKTNYDKVMGEFRKTLSAWASPLSSDDIYSFMLQGLRDKKDSHLTNNYFTFLNFKVNPKVVDSIFVQAATDGTHSDQLLVNMATACPIVRNLDYDGLPY